MRRRIEKAAELAAARRPADLGPVLTDEEATAAYLRLVPRPEVPLAAEVDRLPPAMQALAGRLHGQFAALGAEELSQLYRRAVAFEGIGGSR